MRPGKHGKKRNKPYVTPEQFDALVNLIEEPYASMAFVAVYTGLRASELIGLRWEGAGDGHITIDERWCRRDWGAPKSEASNATVPVNAAVIQRIHRLKTLRVEVKVGPSRRETARFSAKALSYCPRLLKTPARMARGIGSAGYICAQSSQTCRVLFQVTGEIPMVI